MRLSLLSSWPITSGLNGSGSPFRKFEQGSKFRHCPSGKLPTVVPVPGWSERIGTEYASESSERLVSWRSGRELSSELVFVIAHRPIVPEDPVVFPDSSAAVELRKNSVPPLSTLY